VTEAAAVMNKFAWIKALQSDPAVTDAAFRLGIIICVDFTRRDGTGWAVDLDDLAAKVPNGIHRGTMKRALRTLVARGYLVETGRSKGGRGQTGWRRYNLQIPGALALQVSEETPERWRYGFRRNPEL
jgi:hypothetical protein